MEKMKFFERRASRRAINSYRQAIAQQLKGLKSRERQNAFSIIFNIIFIERSGLLVIFILTV
jgi:hypothetical protein